MNVMYELYKGEPSDRLTSHHRSYATLERYTVPAMVDRLYPLHSPTASIARLRAVVAEQQAAAENAATWRQRTRRFRVFVPADPCPPLDTTLTNIVPITAVPPPLCPNTTATFRIPLLHLRGAA